MSQHRHLPQTCPRPWAAVACALLTILAMAAAASAETRWAVIVSGASGGEKYSEQMRQWRADLERTLVDRYGLGPPGSWRPRPS